MDEEARPDDDLPKGFAPSSFEPLFRAIALVTGEPVPEDNPGVERKDAMPLGHPNGYECTREEKIQDDSTSGRGEAGAARYIDSHDEGKVSDSTAMGEQGVNARQQTVNSVISFPLNALFTVVDPSSSSFRTSLHQHVPSGKSSPKAPYSVLRAPRGFCPPRLLIRGTRICATATRHRDGSIVPWAMVKVFIPPLLRTTPSRSSRTPPRKRDTTQT